MRFVLSVRMPAALVWGLSPALLTAAEYEDFLKSETES